ncbi:hypothetical protein GQ457_07G003220 [Hibiscus cannabinus]
MVLKTAAARPDTGRRSGGHSDEQYHRLEALGLHPYFHRTNFPSRSSEYLETAPKPFAFTAIAAAPAVVFVRGDHQQIALDLLFFFPGSEFRKEAPYFTKMT